MPEIFVDPRRCMACRTCEIACGINRDSISKTVAGAFKEEVRPTPRVVVQGNQTLAMPVQCRHCAEAPCLDTCPSGALYRGEDNKVLFDDTRCIGCRMCAAVCPFGAIKPSSLGKVAIKCDACHGMERPFCVEACPTGALAYLDPAGLREAQRRKVGDIVEALIATEGGSLSNSYVKLGTRRSVER